MALGGSSAWSIAADLIDPPSLRYRRDPVLWAEKRAGIELWSKQREILRSLVENPRTAVKSCHSAGKSFLSAVATCWWIDVHPAGDARVITTAPTGKQVDAVLWYEINKLHSRLNLIGTCHVREWKIGRQLVALGRKPPDHAEAAFQGMHAKYLLVIFDEGYGIPEALWVEGSSLASNEYARQLAIGNPDGPGVFQDKFKPNSTWHPIHISYQHAPAFTGETVSRSLAENLISRRWVDECALEWGRDSALFSSKCGGDFPESGDPFSAIPYEWVAQCRVLELPTNAEPVEAGIDVGAGGDRTVMRERQGMRAGREFIFKDNDPMRSIGELVERINEWGVTRVKIDATGIGWGLAGRLRELSSRHNHSRHGTTHSAEVVRVNFGSAPSGGKEKRFLNKRAELYWEVGRENSRLRRWDLTEVDDSVVNELTASRYEILDSHGKVKIEKKDKVIKRLGTSPDRAEALLLAFLDTHTDATGLGGISQVLGVQRGRPGAGSLMDGISPNDVLARV